MILTKDLAVDQNGKWKMFSKPGSNFFLIREISLKSAIKYTGSIQEMHLRGRRKQYKEIIKTKR
jgi:hypothetical protein